MSKVKVFTLAKQFGYKSAEFVDILHNIGFPVSSYQASVEEWDVPIIEERLRKGGLLKSEGGAEDAGKEAAKKSEGGGGPLSFADLAAQMEASTQEPAAAELAVEPAVEVEPEPAPEPEPEPEPTPEPAAEEVVEEEPPAEVVEEAVAEEAPQEVAEEAVAEVEEAAPAAEVVEEEPVAEEKAPEEPQPAPVEEPKAEEVKPSEPVEPPTPTPTPRSAKIIAPPREAKKKAKPKAEKPAAPAAKPAAAAKPPTPKPAAAKAKTADKGKAGPKDGGKGRDGKKGKGPSGPQAPTPKPKRAARKVGKIDLAALGLIKSQHEEKKRSTTFSDIRDRVASTRREQRTRQREALRARRQGKVGPKKVSTVARKKDVVLQSPVTVKAFSTATGISANDIVRKLMQMGVMASFNATLEADTVELLADEMDINIQYREEADIEKELMEEVMANRKAVDDSTLAPRQPVIAFLGHVDHGKTSLIDAIRETRVAGKEAGGITQHVGAYMVKLPTGQGVTILDTPGHKAFTEMRKRGASTTDIVVLVVAADDGVMPQTEEAISHAKAAGTPVVVAINKIDATGANPEHVKSQLANLGLQPEDWGGETGMIEVSALRKQGMDELLERVLLEAEVLDLKAHARGDALGTILEAKLETGRGKMVTVLVQDGTLRVKDVVLAGPTYGKIRLMFDHNGKPVKTAGPSTPVEISGLDDLPEVGDMFYVVKDAKAAKQVAEKRVLHRTELIRASQSKISLSNIFEKIDESRAKHLRFVIKADVQGSVEVLKSTLKELSTDEVIVDIVHSAVGAVSETDVTLAQTAEGIVIAFGVNPDGKAKRAAERENVEIRRYDVIYDLVEDIEKAIEGLLAPDTTEEECGHGHVLEVFRSSRWGSIAGVQITSGVVRRSNKVRVIRDGRTIYESTLESLRRFKDDVREVPEGNECGLKIENFDDIKTGDELEFIEVIEKSRSLEEVQAGAAQEEGEA